MDIKEFQKIESYFIAQKDNVRAEKMAKYMKNKFSFLGISSPLRRDIMKVLFQGKKWDREESMSFTKLCWDSNYRELQYSGIDIISKHKNKLDFNDLIDLEVMVVNKSWWDSVDGLASNPIGSILHKDKSLQWDYVRKWANSSDIWLKRTAIIHQLKYKFDIDTDIMEYCIDKANGTKEFFLNKAIGWMLREYAKTNPDYVKTYCDSNELSNLSRREALKNIS